MNKLTTEGIEIRIAEYFGIRRNLVVPNVCWGLSLHECDVLILTPCNWLHEVEIKRSKSDLLADKKKRHGHCSNKIRSLYFAITEDLVEHVYLIPERAGILVVGEGDGVCGYKYRNSTKSSRARLAGVSKIRNATTNETARKITDNERLVLARLGAMRVWGLKKKLLRKSLEKEK